MKKRGRYGIHGLWGCVSCGAENTDPPVRITKNGKRARSKPSPCVWCRENAVRFFASRAEWRRFGELRQLARIGEIKLLVLQYPYKNEVNGKHICTYTADFDYVREDGEHVVEDVKGVMTEASALRIKVAEACHGIKVTIVPAR